MPRTQSSGGHWSRPEAAHHTLHNSTMVKKKEAEKDLFMSAASYAGEIPSMHEQFELYDDIDDATNRARDNMKHPMFSEHSEKSLQTRKLSGEKVAVLEREVARLQMSNELLQLERDSAVQTRAALDEQLTAAILSQRHLASKQTAQHSPESKNAVDAKISSTEREVLLEQQLKYAEEDAQRKEATIEWLKKDLASARETISALVTQLTLNGQSTSGSYFADTS